MDVCPEPAVGGVWGVGVFRSPRHPTHPWPRSRVTSSFKASFSSCSRVISLAAKRTD